MMMQYHHGMLIVLFQQDQSTHEESAAIAARERCLQSAMNEHPFKSRAFHHSETAGELLFIV